MKVQLQIKIVLFSQSKEVKLLKKKKWLFLVCKTRQLSWAACCSSIQASTKRWYAYHTSHISWVLTCCQVVHWKSSRPDASPTCHQDNYNKVGKKATVLIIMISIIPADLTFEFTWLQFSGMFSFSMTINKVQGPDLKIAGLNLTSSCFSITSSIPVVLGLYPQTIFTYMCLVGKRLMPCVQNFSQSKDLHYLFSFAHNNIFLKSWHCSVHSIM